MRLPYKSCGNLVSQFVRDFQRSFFEAGSGLCEVPDAVRARVIRIPRRYCAESHVGLGLRNRGGCIPEPRAKQKLAVRLPLRIQWDMKIKILICAAVAGCLWGCTASTTIKGTVCSCTDTQITVLEDNGKYYDIIQRTSSTVVNPPVTPPCKAGTPVTVTFNSGDAQRKEGPCPTSPPTQ